MEAVGDPLLLAQHFLAHGCEHVLGAANGLLHGDKIDARCGRVEPRCRIAVVLGPGRRLGEFCVDAGHDSWIARRELAVGEEERVLSGRDLADGQASGALRDLGDGEVRIPDGPGVERTAREGRRGVRRRQIQGCDVAVDDANTVERSDRKVVRAGGFCEADLAALEILQPLDGRVFRDDDRLRIAASGLRGDVKQIGLGGLGEDGGRVTRCAVVDASGVEGFQERRPERELDPFDCDPQRAKALLEQLLLLGDEKHTALLVTDTDLFGVVRCGSSPCERRSSRGKRSREKLAF